MQESHVKVSGSDYSEALEIGRYVMHFIDA